MPGTDYHIDFETCSRGTTTRRLRRALALLRPARRLKTQTESLDREKELRAAWLALPRGAADELAVDARGFVPLETLRVFYRAAAVFAFPSLYEGFGLAPLEAMACGTPVVASNVPPLVEAVGEAAELVTPDNVFDIARGLRAVLLNEDRRRRLSEAGREQAQRFHWEETARQTLEVYREI